MAAKVSEYICPWFVNLKGSLEPFGDIMVELNVP
jgi:hypothetical protein